MVFRGHKGYKNPFSGRNHENNYHNVTGSNIIFLSFLWTVFITMLSPYTLRYKNRPKHTSDVRYNKRFKEFISDIYPKELTISETTESTSVASYLNLLFTRDRSNNITTKLYDKRDAFGFHIVNFPFMSSNIPSAPAYGVYPSQLVRYARCCSNYSDFLIRHRALVKRLLSQGYKVNRLSNTFKKFYGKHTDLVGQYKKNACQMFADSIS